MPYSNISLITDSNLLFQQYDFIQVSHDENNYIIGRVVSYDGNSGSLTFTPLQVQGSGTYSTWNVSLSGPPGISGTSGSTGTSGTSGTSGSTGTSGTSGTSGSTGTSGTSGSTNLLSSIGWNISKEYQIGNTEQLTFAGDYILDNSDLYIEGSEESIEYSQNKLAKKAGKIYIGGNLIIKDSTIENNGEIGVGGSVILIGNSQITGTGIII